MSSLTCFVFLAVLLAIVAADDDRDSCSPGRACQELERRVKDKRDAYETLCNSDSNLTKKCCRDIKKQVKKYEDAYDVFCATKPTPGPTTSQANSTPGPTAHQANSTPGPTTSQANSTLGPTTHQANSTPGPSTSQANSTQAPTTAQANSTPGPTTAELVTTRSPPLPTTQDNCTKALGMQSGAIPNSAVTASSMYTTDQIPYYGRLMNNGDHYCLWSPKLSDRFPWIQIDLGKKSVITGVATQGSCNNPTAWVTSYAIRYSEDGVNWTYYNKGQSFPANKDTNSVVKNEIETPFEARFVRIYPKTKNYIFSSMRLELYGCRK